MSDSFKLNLCGLLLVALFFLPDGAYALNCYKCTKRSFGRGFNEESRNCLKPKESSTNEEQCASNQLCYKLETMIMEQGVGGISRGCYDPRDIENMIQIRVNPNQCAVGNIILPRRRRRESVRICLCDGDLCNRAGHIYIWSKTQLILIGLILFFGGEHYYN